MTDNIVSLNANRSHMAGPVVCTRCQHAWIAVRMVGTIFMECPKCGAERAASLNNLIAAADQLLGDECCGQVDSEGTCCAPACIRGTALKLIDCIRIARACESGESHE